eukprot:6189943-Pleurochrysis_carterae.AAC.5
MVLIDSLKESIQAIRLNSARGVTIIPYHTIPSELARDPWNAPCARARQRHADVHPHRPCLAAPLHAPEA